MADRDGINLRDLIKVFWRARWLILCVTGACMIVAGIAAVALPKRYTATILFYPVSSKSSGGLGGLSSLVSQVGGLGSLVGLSPAGDNEKSAAIATLQSDVLTERYIQQGNLLPVLFASQWDSQNDKWNVLKAEETPTLWKANAFFKKKIRSVAEDKKTGLVSLTITWVDPVIAAKWANELVRQANNYMRDKAIAESERHIAYLNEQVSNTDVAQVRAAIFSILEAEIKNVMLAKGSDEYSLKVIDPAVPSERPAYPQLTLFLLGGLVGGVFISMLLVLFVEVLSGTRKAQ